MQSASRSRILSCLGTVWLVAALVVLAGCSSALPSGLPLSGPLVTIDLEGGMCPEGMCQSSFVIERDGRVISTGDQKELGRVRGEAMAALDAAIQSTDFAAVRSRPFTGTCPIAFDGQEVVFGFSTLTGVQRIASCEVEIDWDHPLFAATAAAVGPIIGLPIEL